MDTLGSSSKVTGQQSRSDEALNSAFEASIALPSAILSDSNENNDLSLIEEDSEYSPSDVLDWETQIYTDENLMAYQNKMGKDEVEEQKGKSTDDSTDK
jgi:hypothetical protein